MSRLFDNPMVNIMALTSMSLSKLPNSCSSKMQSTFTCQRCLVSLRKSLNKTSFFISHSTSSTKRWSCSAAKKDARRPVRSQLRLNQLQQRSKYTHPERPLLRPNDLFHSFSNSPLPGMRKRAAFIKAHAFCPHPSHQPTLENSELLPKSAPAHVDFECPDCGIPVYCSEDHWAEDYENHMELCDILREINEDDHDLRSGREFPEFEYPEPRIEEALVNMKTWDTYLYTREYNAINEMRSLRQVTRLLTYPITIASVIHELSPYHIRRGGRLTPEGLRSFSALRYTLHPPPNGAGTEVKDIRLKPPMSRIFVVGARAESSLPRAVWIQLSWLFMRQPIHLIFIGPESMANRDSELPLPERTPENPFGRIMEDRINGLMKISTYVEYYQTLHKSGIFAPFDPYFDCFVLFHPGLGHPAASHTWEEALPQLLETKVPVICTGYTELDMNRDKQWVFDTMGGEVDLLLEPGQNRFRSLRWDLNDHDPRDISAGNWGVWAFRGKRYDATHQD